MGQQSGVEHVARWGRTHRIAGLDTLQIGVAKRGSKEGKQRGEAKRGMRDRLIA